MQKGKQKQCGVTNIRLPSKETARDIIELAELGKKAGIVFHDLANHITALTLSIGYLEDSFARDSERLREYSRQSEKTRLQMEHVAKVLRAQIEHKKDNDFNPADEIEKILRTFEYRAIKQHIKIYQQIDKGLRINGNPEAFFHIVTNLLSNAIESFENTKENRHRSIEVRLNRFAHMINLSVSDNGSGIAAHHLDKIFDRRFTTKMGGHGIGLSATKEYVERSFRGTIRVKSSRAGTTFCICLPQSVHTKPQKIENPQTKQNRKRDALPALVR